MRNVHMSMQNKLKDRMTGAQDVALTIDIWSDRRQHSFLGITAHTYDVMKAVPDMMLLKFQSFRCLHTGEEVAKLHELFKLAWRNSTFSQRCTISSLTMPVI